MVFQELELLEIKIFSKMRKTEPVSCQVYMEISQSLVSAETSW